MKDLSSLGFRCGVEIHQQVLTPTKLFCRCPAGLYSKEHHAEILRHMRPTLSEMGTYDGCALMEFKTKKEILYLLNKESVCTYEMDDTPPFPINQDALDIAIKIALLLGCQVVDEMHVARKQYLDGSIPTGFQRTAVVGINGFVDLPHKRIRIRQLSIEEDACREVDDRGHLITFRTDRLGMPLIEVVTEPDFESPEEAAEGVKAIGRLLRVTGEVRRGLGSVRQDVNVSIDGGRRVEIKGVPRYQLIRDLTRIEALRQKNLLDLMRELVARGITKDTFQVDVRDITDRMSSTRSEILKIALGKGLKIKGIKIPNAGGLLNWGTQPGKTFANEISDRVRVIACLDEIPNLFHTDGFPEYVGSHIDFRRIKNIFNLSSKDAVIIVWGSEADTKTACEEIYNRIIDAINGVPNETRQHLNGGLTAFERILPGAERMYPDTDHPPLRIDAKRVELIKSNLPEKMFDVEKRFREYGLPVDTIENLALSPYKNLIDFLAEENTDMALVGRLIGQVAISIDPCGKKLVLINNERWLDLAVLCKKYKVKGKYFKRLLKDTMENPDSKVDRLVQGYLEEE